MKQKQVPKENPLAESLSEIKENAKETLSETKLTPLPFHFEENKLDFKKYLERNLVFGQRKKKLLEFSIFDEKGKTLLIEVKDEDLLTNDFPQNFMDLKLLKCKLFNVFDENQCIFVALTHYFQCSICATKSFQDKILKLNQAFLHFANPIGKGPEPESRAFQYEVLDFGKHLKLLFPFFQEKANLIEEIQFFVPFQILDGLSNTMNEEELLSFLKKKQEEFNSQLENNFAKNSTLNLQKNYHNKLNKMEVSFCDYFNVIFIYH